MRGPADGGFKNHFINPPYDPCPQNVLDYSLFTMGYHFGNLIKHFFEPRGGDWSEMFLHHIATNSLFFGFVLANLMGVGSTIALLHDIADTLCQFCKIFGCVKCDEIGVPSLIIMVTVWFITRLNWLPYFIYNIVTNEIATYPEPIKHFNVFIYLNGIFLTALFLLHIHWFHLFVR